MKRSLHLISQDIIQEALRKLEGDASIVERLVWWSLSTHTRASVGCNLSLHTAWNKNCALIMPSAVSEAMSTSLFMTGQICLTRYGLDNPSPASN